jgi:hypothetical protein
MHAMPRNAAGSFQHPDVEMFINDTPLPLGVTVLPGGTQAGRRQRRQTHVHGWELPLRWDLLSQGRGLFLKQTRSVHRPMSSL